MDQNSSQYNATNNPNVPISSRSNRNGPAQFNNKNAKNSRNNLAVGSKVPTPKNQQ